MTQPFSVLRQEAAAGAADILTTPQTIQILRQSVSRVTRLSVLARPNNFAEVLSGKRKVPISVDGIDLQDVAF